MSSMHMGRTVPSSSEVNPRGNSTRHGIFRYLWNNPDAKQKEIARALHLSLGNVKVTMGRLRRMQDLSRRCPECFSAQLLDGVCHHCGFEPAAPVLPVEFRFDEQSPTNSIHAGNSLGSELNYGGVGFVNHPMIVKRWMDRTIEEPLLKDVKSQVMNELKRYYPDETVTDYAGKLVIKDVAEFRAKYPLLATSKNVKKQLTMNVMKRLKILYPFLSPPHLMEVTR